ncbi:uncharacterized protein cubi_03406 [Cryptosporidium ubiquitum]|uniref:Uncharacterized protein n=1 Tax=Cryptosporidium ubiquitum TaxID=857276 RepID=A0A1J4MHB8_9CRYT|nr:uncharacterized protein cubi_03406 [Cryptosporidium ubiquitum]OII73608.1 hypothetical protein cubi_03406 [Cryptosporidium ubiquitum]
MKKIFSLFLFVFAICQKGLGVGGNNSLPDQTRARINLMIQRQIRDFNVYIPSKVVRDISKILNDSISLSLEKINTPVLEYCNQKIEEVLETYKETLPDHFKKDLCYNVIVKHLQLVVNRQHFAENIYKVSSENICESLNTSSPFNKFKQNECSPSLEKSKIDDKSETDSNHKNRIVVTPELAYLISDLIPLEPTHEDCVVAFMRVLSLPFGIEKENVDKLCKSVLEMGKTQYFYRGDLVPNYKESSNYPHKIFPTSKLTPFKRAPPFVEITHPHGIGGIMPSSEKVSETKKSIQIFGKFVTLPFFNSPVQSITHSEKHLTYSQDHSKLSKHEIPKLNTREEIIFNDDIFSDLIFPCKTLNYEAKILASILFYYANLLKMPITTEDACIVCMRSVLVPAISVPKIESKEKKRGITPSEVINPFIPTCVNALMTMSMFSPANKLTLEYIPLLKTSENASKAFGKLCSKTMNKYIQIFGMIGIGNHGISCNPAQILLINSLQTSIWSRFNALFASNELAQVACRVNLDSHASQASGECINLMKKITLGMSYDDIKAVCQSTIKYLQPQPLVLNPILYTISSIFQSVTELVTYNNSESLHISNFIKLSKKILYFSRPKMDLQEYINSCKALVESNINIKLKSKETYKICKSTSKVILNVVAHYHVPLELQVFHKKQFNPRVVFIKKTIENYRDLVKREFSIHSSQ